MYIVLIISQGLVLLLGYILHLLDFKYWSLDGSPTGTFWIVILLHVIAFSIWAESYGVA